MAVDNLSDHPIVGFEHDARVMQTNRAGVTTVHSLGSTLVRYERVIAVDSVGIAEVIDCPVPHQIGPETADVVVVQVPASEVR